MKKLFTLMLTGIVLVISNVHAYSQETYETNAIVIKPFRLAITFQKTSTPIFPYAIKSVDRGSRDILVQKVSGIENVLQLKAGKPGFEQTNLTVITADGKLYSYLIDYADNPQILNIRFEKNEENRARASFSNGSSNEGELHARTEIVVHEGKNIRGVRDQSYGINMQMDALFIKDDLMYCRLKVQNKSNINYNIEQLRFYLRDQQKSRRTATQEIEIEPRYIKGDTAVVIGKTESVLVFVLPKFTIPDRKYLAIELTERNGGRHLQLSAGNKTILKAKPLADTVEPRSTSRY